MHINQQQFRWRWRTLALHSVMLAAPLVMVPVTQRIALSACSGCLFRSVTGLPCPACGMTHAIAALETGNFSAAIVQHPAAPVVMGLLVMLCGYLGAALLLDQRGQVAWRTEARLYRMADAVLVMALVAGWLVKAIFPLIG